MITLFLVIRLKNSAASFMPGISTKKAEGGPSAFHKMMMRSVSIAGGFNQN